MSVCWSIALADRINLLKSETENANRKLKNSEHRLSQILEALPLGVILYGKDQRPKYLNRRTVEILKNPAQGVQPDLSVGRTLAQAIKDFSIRVADSDREYPLEDFPVYSSLQGEFAFSDDIEMDRGTERVALEFWANPIWDDAGNVEFAVVALQDITLRKQAEAELVEYRRRLESLVEERTAEVKAANAEINETNKELRLRLEWLSAILLVNETMARSSDLTDIFEKINETINRLFSIQDSFIAELDEGMRRLRILSHSYRKEDHPNLIGTYTTLPEQIPSDSKVEHGKLIFVLKDQLDSMIGPIGIHFQDANIQSIMLVPLYLRDQVFGFLGMEIHEEGKDITAEEIKLLSIFSIDIAQLIEISQLYKHTKSLITAEERNRLARELHDSVTQTLFTASVLAEATPRIWDKDQKIARQNMDKLSLLIRGALAEMRNMLIELRSGELSYQTLDRLMITLVEAARARSRAVITISVMDIPDLPENVSLALYRIAREAMNNVILHAEATRVDVDLRVEPGQIELRIQDDGCGFDPQTVEEGHLGIKIMRERAEEIGATMRILSKSGRGTETLIDWPIIPEG